TRRQVVAGASVASAGAARLTGAPLAGNPLARRWPRPGAVASRNRTLLLARHPAYWCEAARARTPRSPTRAGSHREHVLRTIRLDCQLHDRLVHLVARVLLQMHPGSGRRSTCTAGSRGCSPARRSPTRMPAGPIVSTCIGNARVSRREIMAV